MSKPAKSRHRVATGADLDAGDLQVFAAVARRRHEPCFIGCASVNPVKAALVAAAAG